MPKTVLKHTKSRILIIDDNALNLKLTKLLLSFEDYNICTARDINEAHLQLKFFQPDLILMDLKIPNTDCLTLAYQLKKNLKYHCYILAVTKHAMKEENLKDLKTGCDGYISKPFKPEKLLTVIKNFLNDKKSDKEVKCHSAIGNG